MRDLTSLIGPYRGRRQPLHLRLRHIRPILGEYYGAPGIAACRVPEMVDR